MPDQQLRLRQLTEFEKRIIGRYRVQHGEVQAPTRSLADSEGRLGFPAIAVDTLSKLEARGSITAGMRAAGEQFAHLFQHAGLDGLKSLDLSRPFTQSSGRFPDLPASGERARRRVAELVDGLGGHRSPLAGVIWHIVGLEWSVQRWALHAQRDRHVSCGLLIGALSALQLQLEGRRRA